MIMIEETGAECDDILESSGVTVTPQKMEFVPDCICPVCYKPLANAQIIPQPDRYRELRRYLGFCGTCHVGSEVIQFKRDGRWVIHKYQVYSYIGQLTHCQASGKWVTLNELPEPAPVVTGPGGEYDQQIRLTKDDVMMLTTLRKGLEAFAAAIECFMTHFGLKE